MQRSKTQALEANINVTPLVDVCLVLLIIFMVVVPQMVTGIPIRLPHTANPQALGDSTRQLTISVKGGELIVVDGLAIRKEQLAGELTRIYSTAPDRAVAVRGDRGIAYGEVMAVLGACRSAGFQQVGLVSESEKTTDRESRASGRT